MTEFEQILEAMGRMGQEDRPPHRCGNCMTPWGRSALPCRNNPWDRWRFPA